MLAILEFVTKHKASPVIHAVFRLFVMAENMEDAVAAETELQPGRDLDSQQASSAMQVARARAIDRDGKKKHWLDELVLECEYADVRSVIADAKLDMPVGGKK